MMKDWDEALLAGYMDGELADEDRRRVEAAIRNDPEARALYDLMKKADAAAKTAFTRPLHEQPPTRLTAMIEGHRVDHSARSRARRLFSRPLGPAWRPAAIAASLAAAIGFAGGYAHRDATAPAFRLAGATANPGGTTAVYEVPLARALAADGLDSLSSIDTPQGDGRLRVHATSLAANGLPCRAFDVALPDHIVKGMACRRPDRSWEILTITEGAP